MEVQRGHVTTVILARVLMHTLRPVSPGTYKYVQVRTVNLTSRKTRLSEVSDAESAAS
jgi:hypothetical protein